MQMHDNSEKYDVLVVIPFNTIPSDEITPLFIIYTLESRLLHILPNFVNIVIVDPRKEK